MKKSIYVLHIYEVKLKLDRFLILSDSNKNSNEIEIGLVKKTINNILRHKLCTLFM